MVRLKNYVLDAWQEGEAPFRALVNPATEAPVAETSTSGLDFAAVMSHAREVGGPALRSMTFAARGAMLKALSKAIYNERERLLDVAMQNGGNTRKDAKFDVDGATATLAYYAGLGKQLGERHHLIDGEDVQLGRSPRYAGLHLLVPIRGAAVHVNAFNFPAWGTFEKAAVAWLAGVPVVTKPATSTAWLTYEMVKIAVESGHLPPGALQLIAGSAGDLLDHLGPQDALAFTGSADTGALLRGGAGPVARSARVNVEADSLNAAALGPDVERGSDLWNWFVRSVVLEMTQKTGQKCTAIRRVFATEGQLDALQEDLIEALGDVVVGDPAHDGVTMGPLTTAGQLRDFQEGVLALAGQAEIVYGSATEVEAVGAVDGKGYYAAPVILRAADARAATLAHEREVFGPAITLMRYEDAADLAELLALGQGSLATSVASSDRAFITSICLDASAWNGRILVVDKKVVDMVTPHGMVMPQLIHGGPGRAGGGEELGGERGLRFYMHRAAIHGNGPLLTKLLS